MFRDRLGMRLRGAYHTFHRKANAFFEPFGVTADQFVVLSLLAEQDGITQRELVEQAFSDPNTIGEMLARLEKKRLVYRTPHPLDGRARCVFLTPKGRTLQAKLLDTWDSDLQPGDNNFRPKELEVLKELLGRIPVAASRAAGGEVA
jgi:DNA-binding MarR family transcriptional regulator